MLAENKLRYSSQMNGASLRKAETGPAGMGSSWISALSLLVISLQLSLCGCGIAADFFSGQQYEFNVVSNTDYVYYWRATDGTPVSSASNTENTFTWKAPEVAVDTAVTITVDVANKNDESCIVHKTLDIIIRPVGVTLMDKVICASSTIVFDADVTPVGQYEYLWQVKRPGTSGFVDLITTSTPHYESPTPATADDNGNQYRVLVTGPFGTITSNTATLLVNSPPEADFAIGQVPECFSGPFEVQFTDASTGATIWSWDFGDEETSTEQSPKHTYGNPGTYTITLTASNACSESTKSGAIRVDQCLPAPPELKDVAVCDGSTATLSVTVIPPGDYEYTWQVKHPGDGEFTDLPGNPGESPIYEFTATHADDGNIYRVYVSGSPIDMWSNEATLTVETAPKADFAISEMPDCFDEPFLVQFTDKSIGATGWSWTFGDGGTSDEQNPAHTYMDAGTYTITLVVENSCGSATKTMQITVDACDPNSPRLRDQLVCVGSTVTFCVSIADPQNYMYRWQVKRPGDLDFSELLPAPVPSSIYEFIATLADDGNQYRVILRGEINGQPVTLYTNVATLTVDSLPTADFTVGSLPDCFDEPFEVQFTDASAGARTWSWDFGDGETSYIRNPKHTYDEPGTYEVKLTIENACCSEGKTRTIVVDECQVAPPELEDQVVCAGSTVTFQTSVRPPGDYEYMWQVMRNGESDFIDLLDEPGESPIYEFTARAEDDGNQYRVVVYGWFGALASNSATLTVEFPPEADFTVGALPDCSDGPFEVEFADQSAGARSWRWDFGDLATSTEQNPKHTFRDAGRYRVTLTVENSCGTDERSVIITIDPCDPNAPRIEDQVACDGSTVTFEVSIPNPDRFMYTWQVMRPGEPDFTDLLGQPTDSPVYEFPAALVDSGNQYRVIVTGEVDGQPVTLTSNTAILTVESPPEADFKIEGVPQCYRGPFEVQFVDQSKGATSWQWEFGDGRMSSEQNPKHKYISPGTYSIVLTVENSCGIDGKAKTITVVQCQVPPNPLVDDEEVCADSDAVFLVSMEEKGEYEYMWQMKRPGESSFVDITSEPTDSPIYEFTARAEDDGNQYRVRVTGKSGGESIDVVSEIAMLTIIYPPEAEFIAGSIPDCSDGPFEVQFTDKSSDAESWSWDFGDGGKSTLKDPTHTFAGPGTYSVTLTVTNICGKDTDTMVIIIPPCSASRPSLTVLPLDPCDGMPIQAMAQVSSDSPKVLIYYYPGDQVYPVTADALSTLNIPGLKSKHMTPLGESSGKWIVEIEGQTGGTTIQFFVSETDQNGDPISEVSNTVHATWQHNPIVRVEASGSQVLPGKLVTLKAVTDGSPCPVPDDGYRWYRGLLPSAETAIMGATSSIFQVTDPGTYTVVVTCRNGCTAKGSFTVSGSGLPPGVSITKSVSPVAVAPGGDVNYTIEFTNLGSSPLTDVVITDTYPDGIYVVSASPPPKPGTDNTWAIGTLLPGMTGMITIRAKVPDVTNISFSMSQGVRGVGFVNVHNDFNTGQEPYTLKNIATLSAAEITPINSSIILTVGDFTGTELALRQSGSGVYDAENGIRYERHNKTIISNSYLSAAYAKTSFALPGGRSIDYRSTWIEKSKAKNHQTGASLSEEFTHLNRIERESSLRLDEGGSIRESETEFEGMGHYSVLKKVPSGSIHKPPVEFESSEDYTGSFHVYSKVDEYGSNVVTAWNATGTGFASADARTRQSQRTYQYGTGSYEASQKVETVTNYIEKDLKAVSAPVSYIYSPDTRVGQNVLWKEGIWSRGYNGSSGSPTYTNCPVDNTTDRYASYIGEEISQASYIDKTAVVRGLNELESEASFTGTGRFRTNVERAGQKPGVALANTSVDYSSKPTIDIDETYTGSFKISRKVLQQGTSRYDFPHLYVSKDGRMRDAILHGYQVTLADYRIYILNDGSRSLGPITIRDQIPTGARFVNASLRPTRASEREIDWTLTHLGVGSSAVIDLTLNVTDTLGDVINLIDVSGGLGGSTVTASNYSVIQRDWLGCCPPKVTLDKESFTDSENPNVVGYRLTLRSEASDTVAARVTDYMPGGMDLIDSSLIPSESMGRRLVWNLLEIRPGEKVVIDYSVRPERDGTYTNGAMVETWSLNGGGSATSVEWDSVTVRGTTVEPKIAGYSDWQPPDWNLSASEEGLSL